MKNPYRFPFTINLFFLFILSILFFIKVEKQKENKMIQVGVTISNFEDKFISYILLQMKEHQKKIDDKMEVVYLDALEDTKKQKEQVKYFIEQEMDAIVILPVDTIETSEMTKMLVEADIPGIYLNKFPDDLKSNQPDNIYYIGPDERTSGVLQMEYLSKLLNGKGDVVILMGDLGDNAAFTRTEGTEKVAGKYPKINVVDKQSAKWIAPLASSIIENWIISGKKFDAIAANNDEMALGAIKTLKKYEKIDEVLVAGIDATEEALSELESGTLSCTVFQDSDVQGKTALEIAFQVANGKAVQNITWIPFQLVTLENYKKFMNE